MATLTIQELMCAFDLHFPQFTNIKYFVILGSIILPISVVVFSTDKILPWFGVLENINTIHNNCRPLPLHQRHMATASMQVSLFSYNKTVLAYLSSVLPYASTSHLQLQKAAKLLDTGAVRATRFLWRYPTARVILLFYLVKMIKHKLKETDYKQ